jgi:DNA-binding GntR family transcriptional regulator
MKTTRQLVYTRIRRDIIMGRLKPGTRLRVEELAKHFDTGTTPVCDALKMLSQEGMIIIKPRAGYFVPCTTLKQLQDMLELREMLETIAIVQAAAKITQPELEELEHIHAGPSGSDDEAAERYMDENNRFHCLIARASGNLELTSTLNHVLDRLGRHLGFHIVQHLGKTTMESSHARIIEALRAHDTEAARLALLDDLVETRDLVLRRVMEQEASTWQLAS